MDTVLFSIQVYFNIFPIPGQRHKIPCVERHVSFRFYTGNVSRIISRKPKEIELTLIETPYVFTIPQKLRL
ncbi:MAG: hypothetical protein P8100_06630 [bacterium]